MKVIERGHGTERVAIVGGIHGDEPAGERIVNRLADRIDDDAEKTIQLIIANEPALKRGERYTSVDLNRSFPGDLEGETYETVLAARLKRLLEGCDAVLALHTSRSAPPPFAVYSSLTESVRRTVTALPVEYALDSGTLRDTTLDSVVPHAVSFETGRQGSEEAVEVGFEGALSFLRAHGAVTDMDPSFTETTVVEGQREVPKGDGTPHVYYNNFEPLPKGAIFAEDDTYTHRVEHDDLVPVLASEHGYENLFGVYATVKQTLDPPS
ncbi:M14 family metallopeptidase [Halorubrum vacuolatum]|uniref:Succinylglutamate desuccinylase / Aspartoacylase family protein n=1 Tax=Halorubrum vacuolatum TaxID=63740 RepID=A0A238Y0G1_HALVU|nr:succinylglutamate desuccinylase/aspartoacylase family protein [Halorubrum vacuolatum]SNR64123.1 Succinylglutamate desuccinylase / Aspartoacylase family protein [Halorubrum vacuolatum]